MMLTPLDNPDKLKRKHKVHFTLNDLEKEALEKYYKKYKIKNKSKFLREAVISQVLKQFDEDYPSLFDDNNDNQKTLFA